MIGVIGSFEGQQPETPFLTNTATLYNTRFHSLYKYAPSNQSNMWDRKKLSQQKRKLLSFRALLLFSSCQFIVY